MSKGSWYRKVDGEKYRENYDRIFGGKDKSEKKIKGGELIKHCWSNNCGKCEYKKVCRKIFVDYGPSMTPMDEVNKAMEIFNKLLNEK